MADINSVQEIVKGIKDQQTKEFGVLYERDDQNKRKLNEIDSELHKLINDLFVRDDQNKAKLNDIDGVLEPLASQEPLGHHRCH